MANIKQQKKRVKTNEKRRVRNMAVRSAVKTEIRKFRELVAAGEVEAAARGQFDRLLTNPRHPALLRTRCRGLRRRRWRCEPLHPS